jgi:rubredoxin
MVFCGNCGNKIEEGLKCQNCGWVYENPADDSHDLNADVQPAQDTVQDADGGTPDTEDTFTGGKEDKIFCGNCGRVIEEGLTCQNCGWVYEDAAGDSFDSNKDVQPVQELKQADNGITDTVGAPAGGKEAVFQNQDNRAAAGADEKYCFSCGEVIKKEAQICMKCGVRQNARGGVGAVNVYCASCGKTIKKEAAICPHCGVRNSINAQPFLQLFTNDKKGYAIASLVLGLCGLVAWLLPLLGLPVTIVGIVMGVLGLKYSKNSMAVAGFTLPMKRMAVAGVVLSIVGVTAAIANSSLGAYQGFKKGQLIGTWAWEDNDAYYFTFASDDTVSGYYQGGGTYDDAHISLFVYDSYLDTTYIFEYTYKVIEGKLHLYPDINPDNYMTLFRKNR